MIQGRDTDAVERLYLRLAGALQESGRGFEAAVSVAEIYQELVPYRLVRSDVGFGMNADYEHALLRLLAGEGGYVRLEPSQGVSVLRRELDSPNPNLGAYREFAGCDAWIAPPDADLDATPAPAAASDWLEDVADDDGDVATDGDDWNALATLASDTADEPAATFAFVETAPPPAAAEPPVPESASESATDAPKDVRCSFCDSTLPAHRTIRFCPFCGADQSARPCGQCGESLEAGWAFCVACGATRD